MNSTIYCFGGPKDGTPIVSQLPSIRFPVAEPVVANYRRANPERRDVRYDRHTFGYPLECTLNGSKPRVEFVDAYIVEGDNPDGMADAVCNKAIQQFLQS